MQQIPDNNREKRLQQLKEILVICSTSLLDPEEDNREMSAKKSRTFLLERPIEEILKKVASWERERFMIKYIINSLQRGTVLF